MNLFELLESQYPNLIIKKDSKMPPGISGLYFDNHIFINSLLSSYAQNGVLAEEIGHYETTYGDIIDLSDIKKKKLEIIARRWGYENVISLDKIIECYKQGNRTLDEVCVFFEITPTYLENVLDFYKIKYGTHKFCGDYKVLFDPLNIVFDDENKRRENISGGL